MKKSSSSKQWLRRHVNDPYVKRSKREGYRSRSAYKLPEIDDRDKLLKPGMVVVDLGAAPGGWSQVAAKRVGGAGAVATIDLLPMDPVAGVTVIEADFSSAKGVAAIEERLAGRKADIVLSDMAPNLTGIGVSDQARSMALAEIARDFALLHLQRQGALLVKIFQGAGYDEYLKSLRRTFEKVVVRKPDASRDESAEQFLLARHPGSVDGRRPHEVQRDRRSQAGRGALAPHEHLRLVVPDAAADRRVDLLHAPDAGRGTRGCLLVRQEPRAHVGREPEPGDVRRRGGRGRGQGGSRRARRLTARSVEVPEAGRSHSARRADGGLARHRQDAARARHRR